MPQGLGGKAGVPLGEPAGVPLQQHCGLLCQRLARLLLWRGTVQRRALRRLPPGLLDELHHALGAKLLAVCCACCPGDALIHQNAAHVVAAGYRAGQQGKQPPERHPCVLSVQLAADNLT